MKKKKNKFSHVNMKWLKKKMIELKISPIQLASGLNVSRVQVLQWLSGHRKPSKACIACIYYYIEYGLSHEYGAIK